MSKSIDLFDLALGVVIATAMVITYLNAQSEPQRIIDCRDVGGTPQFSDSGQEYRGCKYD